MLKKCAISMRYFLQEAHSTEQTPCAWMFPFGTDFAAESTGAIRVVVVVVELSQTPEDDLRRARATRESGTS